MSTHSRHRPGSDTQGRSASAQSSPQPHSFETYATGMQAEASVPLRPPPGLEEEPAPDELDPVSTEPSGQFRIQAVFEFCSIP